MTRAGAASRVTQADAMPAGTGGGTGSGAREDPRTLRYSNADLESIRAMLAAFRAGDFRPRLGNGAGGETGHGGEPMAEAV